MYEQRSAPPATRAVFLWRLAGHSAAAAAVMLASLGAGMAGYHHYEKLSWLDAFLNAAMLLGGMGPVEAPASAGGKLFAGLYALYSGVVFLLTASVLMVPVVHRLLHEFHWAADDPGAADKDD